MSSSSRRVVGVLGEQAKPRRSVAPDLLQVGLDGLHPLRLEVVDPPSAPRLLGHHTGVLQEAKVARNGRAADGHRVGDLPYRLVATAEKAQDFASIAITKSLKRVSRDRRTHRSRQFSAPARSPPRPGSVTNMLP